MRGRNVVGVLARAVVLVVLGVAAACGPTPLNDNDGGIDADGRGGGEVVLTAIEVSPPSPMLAANTSTQLSATGDYSDSTTQDLTSTVQWGSSDDTVATVDRSGKVTAVGGGRAMINATSGGQVGTAVVTVSTANLMSIAVTPDSPTLPLGTTQQLTATGTFSDGSTQDLTQQVVWATATATIADVSTLGLAVAKTTGSSRISATLGSVVGTTTIMVSTSTLASIVIGPAVAGVPVGYSRQLSAVGHFSDNTTKDVSGSVTWASSDATLATVTATGVAAGVATGMPRITATMGTVVGTATFAVSTSSLQSLGVTPANPSVVVGLTQQFAALATFADATTLDVTTQITWSSSTTADASISNAAGTHGLATAATAGTTTISATKGSVVGSTMLTVTGAPLTSITVTPATVTISIGNTQQFTATGKFSDGSTQDITTQSTLVWSTSAAATASISNATGSRGLAKGLASGGPITVTAKVGTISGTAMLTVSSATIKSIAVTPATTTVTAGGSQPYTATATLSDNSTQDVTSNASWASSNSAIAQVSTSGLATASATMTGTVTISATMGTIMGAAMLTVQAAACDGLVISQIYGGGGNSGAAFAEDFVELFNQGSQPVSLAGKSVQYAAAASATWSVAALPAATVPPGGYYLVGMYNDGTADTQLPAPPDATFTINLSTVNGKVALVNDTTALTGTCPMGTQDFVGYGTANCNLGGAGNAAESLESDASLVRESNGCTNTKNNLDDWDLNFFGEDGSVNPRTSADTVNVCASPICD